LHFELHVTAVDEPHVVAQWTMTGTQFGPLNGLPPTEARIKLPGIDVITLGESGLLSVEGYFDQRTLLEQLGAQVTVQPANVGPLAFGTSIRLRSSNTSVPGALTVTWMDVRSEQEGEDVKERAGAIAAELARAPGFIGWIGVGIAERLYTLTLWEDPEAIRQPERAASTRQRYDKCSRRTSALPFTPVFGFLNISIRSGCGVRSAEP
jgi:hypothetical protein